MHPTALNWVLSVLLVTVSGLALTEADYYCSDFDTDPSGIWVNTGSRYWYWSGSLLPSYMPDSFSPINGGYMWFQDNQGAPNTGTIVTVPATGITIYPNDAVSIAIYRYIIEFDGSYRPVLNFVSDGIYKQNIAWSFDDEAWTTISILCGNMDEPCCLTYPCTGYFSVDGSILARDELLAIDDIQLNDGCSIVPPPTPSTTTTTTTLPPPPPPPSSWCCHFDTEDVCAWSLATISNGWHWSGYLTPSSFTVPPATGNYVWEEDTSALLYSTGLKDVYDNAQIEIDYYFQTDGTADPMYNHLEFSFESTSTGRVILLADISTNSPFVWTRLVTPAGVSLCGVTGSVCDGTFQVTSYSQPGHQQIAAIDNFSVNGATC